MSRNLLDLDVDEEFDKYEEQLKDAEATRARLLKAKQVRNEKRKALSLAVKLSMAKVEARIRDRVEKFDSKRRQRQAQKDLARGHRLQELMKLRDEKLGEMIKNLLDRRQESANLALQLQTVHKSVREDLEAALKTKGPKTEKKSAETTTKKATTEVEESTQEEEDDIDTQDLFDFAMKVTGESQHDGPAVEDTGRSQLTAHKRRDVKGKQPVTKSVAGVQEYLDKHRTDHVLKEQEAEGSTMDLKLGRGGTTKLADIRNTDAMGKGKEVEVIDLDGPSIVVAQSQETVAGVETKQQKSSPMRTYSRKSSKSDTGTPDQAGDSERKDKIPAKTRGRRPYLKGKQKA